MSTQIVTGKKYHILTDLVNKVWSVISFWTKASDVEFNDGKTAQTKLGAINGITSDLNGESESIAASIKAVNQLNNSLIVSTALYVNVNPITIPAGSMGEIPLQLVSGKVGAHFIGITRVYTGSWGLSVVGAGISSIMAINHTAYAITVGAKAAAVGAAYLG